MFRSKFLAAAVVVSLVSSPLPANAGGGLTGGATEITQMLNNAQLLDQVAQQAKTVSQLVQTYRVTYDQLQQQVLAGTSIGNIGIGDIMKVKSDLDGYQSALRGLNGDLGSMGRVFDTRITEARLSNLTLEGYVRREAGRIDQGNAQAKARVSREMAQAEQINRDVQLVRDMGDKIPATVGVHASTQLLNSQMNMMLQQMTRLVAATNEAQGSDKANEALRRSEELAERGRVRDQVTAMERSQKDRERAVIESMRNRP